MTSHELDRIRQAQHNLVDSYRMASMMTYELNRMSQDMVCEIALKLRMRHSLAE